MRLLCVSSYFDTHPGGLEKVAAALAEALGARPGWTATWLACDATPTPADAGAVAHAGVPSWNIAERRLGAPFPLIGPRAVARIFAHVRRVDAVLVHDGLYLTSVAAVLAARLFGRPVLMVQHIGLVPYRNPALRLAMRLGDALVARPTAALADERVFISRRVQSEFGGRRSTHLILNGVNARVFRPAQDGAVRRGLRADLGLAPDARVAMFAGRFVEKKGLRHVRAAAGARPDITWIMAGWGDPGPETWGLPNVRVERGRSGQALADLYRAADVFVLPSVGEGFPLVVQEALACGLPAVCGLDAAAADPEAAQYLYPIVVDDTQATVHRLVGAVDMALAEAGRHSQARAAFARSRYDWETAVERYAALLGGAVARRAVSGRAGSAATARSPA